MAEFSRSGRGAALKKVLEQPLRRPGHHQAMEQSTVETGSSAHVTQPTQTSMMSGVVKPMGRGILMSTTPVAPPSKPELAAGQTTPMSSPAFQRETPSPLGRGFLLKQAMGTPPRGPKPVLMTPPPSLPSTTMNTPLSQIVPPTIGLTTPTMMTPPISGMSQLSIEQKAPSSTEQKTPSNNAQAPQTAKTSPPVAAPLLNGEMKQGTNGHSVPLGANYLALQTRTDGVFQYVVSYSPPVESRNMRYGMLNEHKDLIGSTRAFDGSTLYLPIKITDTSVTRVSKRATDGADIEITIALTNVLHFNECMQLFNIIIRRVLRALDLQQVGRQYYDSHHPIQVTQHKMELWPGYVTAIHQFDGGLLLLLDVSHKLLRMDTALDFLYELYSSNQHRFQEEATRQLVGSVVLTRYNNRTYRIDDLAWDKNPQSTFIDHTGKAITFIEYYNTAYGRTIEDTEQPLLLHRPKKRRLPRGRGRGQSGGVEQTEEEPEQVICLVPELCSMTGLTDKARNDFRVMKDLAVHTRISPNQRDVAIRKFVSVVNSNQKAKEELSSWGLALSPNMLQTTGRKLLSEKIHFKENSIVAGLEADWNKELIKEHVISAVPLRKWLLVFTKRDSSKAMDFLNMMKKVAPPMGIEVRDAIVVELPNDRTENYIRAIREQIKSSLQLVVIIFPSSRDDRYSSVKKLCCIEHPIPSQVINARTISQQQKLRSVTQKIALQINCKLGGELWAVDIPLKNIMVVGIDVYHDSSRGKRSILGIVSSTNRHLTRWYSRVSIHDKNQEIADGLNLCLQSALRKYHELNQTLPERILVFRDGVGDGQMATVLEFEIPQMIKCFSMFGEDYKPRLAVIVVQKRISTRIFGQGPQGYQNPPPGTVMDHTITRKGWYDFFLVSQHVRQGTVTPTHYNVVADNTGLKPDHMQRLAYKLTHLYYNWPGTVRVPAPCQYAHKLAFLVGQSLHREPSLDICDRLFFL